MDARELYRRWIDDLWNGRLDDAGEVVADDFVGHWPDHEVTGPRSLAKLIDETRGMFDQVTFVITVGPLVDGDMVAARWVGEGENADGPATFFGNDIVRVVGNGDDLRIAEYWVASGVGISAADRTGANVDDLLESDDDENDGDNDGENEDDDDQRSSDS